MLLKKAKMIDAPVVLSLSESSSSTFDGLDESANAKEFSKHPLNRKMESLLHRAEEDKAALQEQVTDPVHPRQELPTMA